MKYDIAEIEEVAPENEKHLASARGISGHKNENKTISLHVCGSISFVFLFRYILDSRALHRQVLVPRTVVLQHWWTAKDAGGKSECIDRVRFSQSCPGRRNSSTFDSRVLAFFLTEGGQTEVRPIQKLSWRRFHSAIFEAVPLAICLLVITMQGQLLVVLGYGFWHEKGHFFDASFLLYCFPSVQRKYPLGSYRIYC